MESLHLNDCGDKKNPTEEREWIFNLVVTQYILPNEFPAVTGGCQSLGHWHPAHSILMKKQEEGSNIWKVTIKIPRYRKIPYRYCICAVERKSENIIIRRWETHLQPRIIDIDFDNNTQVQCEDSFGVVNGVEQIQRGWLTTEYIVQLKFFNDPFILPYSIKERPIYIRITPKMIRIEANSHQPIFIDAEPSDAFVEVARLIHGESAIQVQEKIGTACGVEDFLIFHITVHNFNCNAYLIEFFYSGLNHSKTFHCIGYNHIFPTELLGSEGHIDLPILTRNCNSPIGITNFQYLIIKPMKSSVKQNMKVTLAKHWKNNWTDLDIGHRGTGTSYKVKSTDIPEDTIASIKYAAASGADIVEFDVHLTKDLIPVAYHDFQVNIARKDTIPMDMTDLTEIPIKDLTLQQLKNTKIYHMCEGVIEQCPFNGSIDTGEDYESFPSLEKLLKDIDRNVAFDIELKWPQPYINGKMEGKQTIDKNAFVDKMLEVVLCAGHGRYIILSSFDVDICAMLRFKQNIYPIMFLTLGYTKRYPLYMDPRCVSIEKAVCNAQAMDFLGVILHSEDFLKDPSLVSFVKELKQIVFCWGNDSRIAEALFALKGMGLDGVIYDRCDVHIKRTIKRNNFREEAKRYSDLLGE